MPKRIDTPAGTVTVAVPKTAGHEGERFYPQSLERGRRSVRAVMLAVAEKYINGVSTREVEAVMREFVCRQVKKQDVLWAYEIQSVRGFGSESATRQVQTEGAGYLPPRSSLVHNESPWG